MTLPETLVNREHPLGLLKQSARVIPMTAILEGETILISWCKNVHCYLPPVSFAINGPPESPYPTSVFISGDPYPQIYRPFFLQYPS